MARSRRVSANVRVNHGLHSSNDAVDSPIRPHDAVGDDRYPRVDAPAIDRSDPAPAEDLGRIMKRPKK